MPGDYTARTKSGFMPLTRTKHRLNLAREEDINAMRLQARPKAMAKNGPSDRMTFHRAE
jgi:hypothetical protein